MRKTYIILETSNRTSPVIMHDKDGLPLRFSTKKKAKKCAKHCMRGVIVSYNN